MQIKRLLLQAFLIAAIFLVVLIWSVPFIWMFLGSIKEADVIASTDLVLLFKPTLEHYRTIFLKYPFSAIS